jgi:uncharacterized repeat protein (TIGR03803 family)
MALAILAILFLTCGGAHAQPFEVLHDFGPPGPNQPRAQLLLASDGSLYGTTRGGGAADWGTAFRLAPDGTFSIVHAFTPEEGSPTQAPLVEANGAFYGMTRSHLFRLAPDGTFTVLQTGEFGHALIRGRDGNIYGTTDSRVFRLGPSETFTDLGNFGSDNLAHDVITHAQNGYLYLTTDGYRIFRMTTSGGDRVVVHQFDAATEGSGVQSLVEASDGNFYGTTFQYGPAQGGTLFRMTPDGTVNIMHAFARDTAVGILNAIVQGPDGDLYGTAQHGGASGQGVVFKATLSGTITTLYEFTGGDDGGTPWVGLAAGADGNFYGVTSDPVGAIFKITPAGVLTVLHAFTWNATGKNAYWRLVRGQDQNLYGIAPEGGPHGAGTLFRVTTSGDVELVHGFAGNSNRSIWALAPMDGAWPTTLIGGDDGLLYGMTRWGGLANRGTIFKATLDGVLTTLHAFRDPDTGASGLFSTPEGLYGNSSVSFFRLGPDGVYSVTVGHAGARILARDGFFYGITGGAPLGSVSITRTSRDGTTTVVFSTQETCTYILDPRGFPIGISCTMSNGPFPRDIVEASDGEIYVLREGRLDRMATDGTMTYVAAAPGYSIGLATDGNFYLAGERALWKLTRDGTLTTLHTFTEGMDIFPSLPTEGSDGRLYGVAKYGGAFGNGFVFRINDVTGPTTTATLSPAANAAGWNREPVTVHLAATDASGVARIVYAATGAQSIPTTSVSADEVDIPITAEGITIVTFFAIDTAGNRETARTLTVKIDRTPPVVRCSANPAVLWPPNQKLITVTVNVTVSDALSGSAGVQLMSATSSDPATAAQDIVGWAIGGPSTSGQLRAARRGRNLNRIYALGYLGFDQAGNTSPCVATVLVPHDQGTR